MSKPLFIVMLTSLALAACGQPTYGDGALGPGAQEADSAATERCLREKANVAGYGRVDGLVGAFEVSMGELATWSENRHGTAGPTGATRWSNRTPTERVVVCYFDGSFSGFPRPPSDVPPAPYERLMIVTQGASGHVLDSAGYRATLPVIRPVGP